jgi:hypothetical protein
VVRPRSAVDRVTAAAADPGGDVTFFVDGVAVGTAPVIASTATLSHTFTTTGSHALRATYNGNANVAAVSVPGDVEVAAAAVDQTPLPLDPAPGSGPTPAPQDAAAPESARGAAAAAELALTGAPSQPALPLAAALLIAGIVLRAAGRATLRRDATR